MIRKTLTCVAAAAIAAGSVATAAPAAASRQQYHEQKVTGVSQLQCEDNGDSLAAEKQAQGYAVTWTGTCDYQLREGWYGYVAWSDG